MLVGAQQPDGATAGWEKKACLCPAVVSCHAAYHISPDFVIFWVAEREESFECLQMPEMPDV